MSPPPLPFSHPSSRPPSSVLATTTFSIFSSPMSFCSVSPSIPHSTHPSFVRNLSLPCSAFSSPSSFPSLSFSPVLLSLKKSVRVSRDVRGIRRRCCHAVGVDDNHRYFCSSPLLSTVICYPSLMDAENDFYLRRETKASFGSKPCVIIIDHDHHPLWWISYSSKFIWKDRQNVYRRHLLQRHCTKRRGISVYGGGGSAFSTWMLKKAASFSLFPSLHFSARTFSSCDASFLFASYLPTLSSNTPLCVSSPSPSTSSLVSSSSLASSSTSSSSSVSLSSSVASFMKSSSSPSCRFGSSSSTSTSSAYSSMPSCALGHSPLALPCEAISFASSSGSLSPINSSSNFLSFASAVCPASLPSPSLSSTCSASSSSYSLSSSLQSDFVSSSLSLSSSSSISSFSSGFFRLPHLLRHVSFLRAFGISSADCEYICSQHFSLMSSSTLMTTSSQFEEFKRLVEFFISCGMTVAHIRELLIINPEVFFCSDFEAIRRRVVDLVNCGVPPEDFADLLRDRNSAEVNGEGEEGKSKNDRIILHKGLPQSPTINLSERKTIREVELNLSSSSSSSSTSSSLSSNAMDTEKQIDHFSLPHSLSYLSSSKSFPSSFSVKNTSAPSVGRIFEEHKFHPSLCSKILQMIDHHRVFPPAFLEDLSVSLRFLRNALQNDELLNLRLANFPQLFEDNVRKLIFPRVSFLRFIETHTPNTSDFCYNYSNTSSSKGSTTISVLKSSSFHDLFGTSDETFVVKVACRSLKEYQKFLKDYRISSLRGPAEIGGNRSVDLNGCAEESERLKFKKTCSNSKMVTKSECESNKSSNSNHDMKGACLNSVGKNLHSRISMKQEELENLPSSSPSLPPSFYSPPSSITSSDGFSSGSVPPSTISTKFSSYNSSSLVSSSPLLLRSDDAGIPVVTSSTFSSPPSSPASSCAAALGSSSPFSSLATSSHSSCVPSSSSSVSSSLLDADEASLDFCQFLRKYFHGTTEKHLSELRSICHLFGELDDKYLRIRLKLIRENFNITNIWTLQRFLKNSPEMMILNWRVVITRLNVLKTKNRISQGILVFASGKSPLKKDQTLGFLMRCSPVRFCQLMDIDIKYLVEEIEKGKMDGKDEENKEAGALLRESGFEDKEAKDKMKDEEKNTEGKEGNDDKQAEQNIEKVEGRRTERPL